MEMRIKYLDVIEAITYPFKKENLSQTVWVTILLAFLAQFVPNAAQFISIFVDDSNEVLLGIIGIGVLGWSLFVSIPISLYLQGYLIESMRLHMRGEENGIPTHSDFGTKLKDFLAYMVMGFAIFFVVGLISIPLIIGVIYLIAESGGAGGAQAAAVISIILFGLLAFVAMIVAGMLVQPAMLYIYLKTGSLSDAFSIQYIREVLNHGWKDMLLGVVILVVIGFITTIPLFLLFFLMPLLQPLISVVGYYAGGYVYGNVYAQIDKKIHGTSTNPQPKERKAIEV